MNEYIMSTWDLIWVHNEYMSDSMRHDEGWYPNEYMSDSMRHDDEVLS